MSTQEFEQRIKKYSRTELRQCLSGLDSEKYPERVILLQRAIEDYVDRPGEEYQKISPDSVLYTGKKLFAKHPAANMYLALSTFFMYQFVWLYKSWKRKKEIEGSSISPFWRSVFFAFSTYWLFSRVKISSLANGTGITVDPMKLAVLAFLSKFYAKGDSIFSQVSTWLAVICAIYFAYEGNRLALAVNSKIASADPNFEPLTRFEKIFAGIGLVLWSLILLLFVLIFIEKMVKM